MCVLSDPPRDHGEARLAFEQWLDGSGADDLYTVGRRLRDGLDDLPLDTLLSMLRLSQCDPKVLLECAPILAVRAQGASEASREDLLQIIERAWQLYYHIDEPLDLPFELGVLLFAIDRPLAAAVFFEHSLRLYGPDASTWWNLGLCHYHAHRIEEATAAFQAAARDPAFRPAGCLQPKVRGARLATPPKAPPPRSTREAER